MTNMSNKKAAAWDRVGGLFWSKGRATARPSQQEIDLFLEGLPRNSRVAVIGASTKELIEAAQARGLKITVLDFSAKMCADLSAVVESGIAIHVHDITAKTPQSLARNYDAVISDRLINRFTHEEGVRALSGMLELARDGGEIRTSIKMGFYPMDERMIAEGRRRGTLKDFFDAKTQTIDFPSAGDILEACLLPHGEIEREILLEWYRGRGRESRFSDTDIRAMVEQVKVDERCLSLAESRPFPNASGTTYYTFSACVAIPSVGQSVD